MIYCATRARLDFPFSSFCPSKNEFSIKLKLLPRRASPLVSFLVRQVKDDDGMMLFTRGFEQTFLSSLPGD